MLCMVDMYIYNMIHCIASSDRVGLPKMMGRRKKTDMLLIFIDDEDAMFFFFCCCFLN